jgi:sugar phosphate isomerase/epimerase
MIPAISQVCSLNSTFASDVNNYAAGQCQTMEVWLTKLETYLESHSVADAKRLLDQHGMSAPVASYQGGLLTTQGEARRQAWDHLDRRLALCHELGMGTLVVAADIGYPFEQHDVERTRVSLRQLAQQAEQHQMRVALEFQARSAFANNLQTATALIAEVNSPHLGVCLDLFHYYVGPSKRDDLEFLAADNLLHVQLADLAGVPREFASDSDRILPGDGDFQFGPIVEHLRRVGYTGCVSVELMNPQLWQVPVRQFVETGLAALRKVLVEG